jgi:Tol biopolymer transport system component
VLDHVAYSPVFGSAHFDVSNSGTLVYQSGGAAEGGQFTAQWLDEAGKAQPLLAKPDNYLFLRLSPDGQRLALSAADVWIYEWRRDTLTRLTFSGATSPVWSPDGRYIVFRVPGGMFWTRSDGAGKPQALTQSKVAQTPYTFTPDGKRLAFHEIAGTGYHLWTLPVESDGAGLQESRSLSGKRNSTSGRRPSLPTAAGWLILRMNRECIRCMCGLFPTKAASGKSPTAAAYTRCFRATGESCSSAPRTTGSWLRRTP